MSVRTTSPDNSNKYYISTFGGGYNNCIFGNINNPYKPRPSSYSVLPNCVGYAYGRYLEYYKLTSANLPTCNAKDWYAVAKTRGFKCSTTPSVGSVAVFAGTTYGHVAFVERIEANGDLFLSESNWSHQFFRNVTVKKANGYAYSSALKLVGFIANPNVKVEKPKTTTTKKVYKKGNYKVTADVLNVRTGAGTKYSAKKYAQLTASAQKNILKLAGYKANGYVKGLEFTVLEVKDNWGRTPSGWVCLDYCKKI